MSRSWGPLAALLVSRAGALTGHRLLLLAVPWLVITTGTLTEAGTVALCHTLPYVIMQGLSGPLLDRSPPARVAAGGDLIGAAAVATLAAAGTPPLWLLMTAMAVIGAADGPAAAAKNVLLPDVTVAACQPPDRGQALAVVAERAASTLGPAMAGLLISLYGTSRTLWLASLLFSVTSALTWRIRLAERRAVASEPDSYLQQLWAGVRVVFRDRPLRAITIMYIVTNCLDSGLIVILIPLWARENGHGATFAGLMLSAAGGAAVCSAIAAAWLGARLPRQTAYLVGVIISGPTRIIVLALDCPPTVIIVVYAIAGVGSGIFNPALRATIAEVAPAELRGRVFALVDALSWIGLPIAGLFATTAVSAVELTGTLWAFGIAYLLAVLYPVRRITRHPALSVVAAIPAPRRHREPGTTSRDITPQWST
ncbi:MFS family permease [Actinoplanes campanulatus]|uniref:MFS family permease n=1 Tax=Actinoplanes campanulatus TaxID=113559 RepID=A0A7W5AKG6_9ACTN|nr:MFS transporter [Actinoplanes campanulatus]MBB3097747.1 MFS family permease [Actinoplanes campanulatus]GGN38137.1 putative drug antiporter protein precursor [Actinoplanes campanulatus]GID39682.1 putative drug antiporter protein precursor [Actinoplanes campanulatus]